MQRSRKFLLAVLKKNEQADKGTNEQLDKKWTNGQIEDTMVKWTNRGYIG